MIDLGHCDSDRAKPESLGSRSNFYVAGVDGMVNKMKDVNQLKDVESYIWIIIEFSISLVGDIDLPVLRCLISEQPKAFPKSRLPA